MISFQVPAGELSSYVFVPSEDNLYGKNGYQWFSKPTVTAKGKTPAKNIVYVKPGPPPELRNILDPVRAFQQFISDEILEIIVQYTNQKIRSVKQNYKREEAAIVAETSLEELKALIGLYILAGVLKDNHLATDTMFNTTFCGTRYKATMSQKRFEFLTACLRFDDADTRDERRKISRFTPIEEIWNKFIEACRTSYKPGSYVTIDEQLVGFRGHCAFRMYMPNKPAKYGLKLVLLCDVSTKYLIDAAPYIGKSTKTDGLPLSNYYVETLTKSIHGSSRNVTMDNWFTSIPLAEKLLTNPYKLTVVGTLRKNKKEVPKEFITINKDRKVHTSLFAYNEKATLVSYKPKANKHVLLLSTMHETGAINDTTHKPEIIHTYNSTKGAVDTFDQMCQNMNCNRKTKRWPMCIFYNLLNMACINSFVIHSHNVISHGGKPKARDKYMQDLHVRLTQPWQSARLAQNPRFSIPLRTMLEEVLGERQQFALQECIESQKGRRTYCHMCPSAKKSMTTTYCLKCNKAICGAHQQKICPKCL